MLNSVDLWELNIKTFVLLSINKMGQNNSWRSFFSRWFLHPLSLPFSPTHTLNHRQVSYFVTLSITNLSVTLTPQVLVVCLI